MMKYWVRRKLLYGFCHIIYINPIITPNIQNGGPTAHVEADDWAGDARSHRSRRSKGAHDTSPSLLLLLLLHTLHSNIPSLYLSEKIKRNTDTVARFSLSTVAWVFFFTRLCSISHGHGRVTNPAMDAAGSGYQCTGWTRVVCAICRLTELD